MISTVATPSSPTSNGSRCWVRWQPRLPPRPTGRSRRTGFLTSVVTARVSGTETDVATYLPNSIGVKGQLQISGQTLQLKGANFWATQWILLDGETPLLQFGSHGVFKAAAKVTVTEAARQRPDLPLLLCFVWYILVLHMEDSSTAAVVAT